VIIETKFHDKAFLSRFDSADKLRPGHRYQMDARLRNIASMGETDAVVGVFLYSEDMALGDSGSELSVALPRRVAGRRSRSASKSLDSATTPWQRTSASARRSVCDRVHLAIEGNSDVGV
jgi:hypothetical protein